MFFCNLQESFNRDILLDPVDPAPRIDSPTQEPAERQTGVGDDLEALADVRLEAQNESEGDNSHESG
jgi:hypothetical protein